MLRKSLLPDLLFDRKMGYARNTRPILDRRFWRFIFPSQAFWALQREAMPAHSLCKALVALDSAMAAVYTPWNFGISSAIA